MIHIFLNGSGANAGGGLTYLNNVIPHLSARNDLQVTVLVSEYLRQSLGEFPNISFLTIRNKNAAKRFWQEQTTLPKLIRQTGAEVLISTGNFALRKSPIPQILLSRNSLYVSDIFFRDLLSRRNYRLYVDTRIKAFFAKCSITWADLTVAPTLAFAEQLRRWTTQNVVHIPHGFDSEFFFRDQSCLPAELNRKLEPEQDELRLLFVSHYNYYRNFETLLRAIPVLRGKLPGTRIKLFLTCTLNSKENPGSYHAAEAACLIHKLGIQENVIELGSIPYHLLHHIYRACDFYVTAAYAESFAHPLVEAMASGLPVVASDLSVHKEICGPAALYFNGFSPEKLVEKVLILAQDDKLSHKLSSHGTARARDFSWGDHVEQLVLLSDDLLKKDRTIAESKLHGS